MVAGSLAQPLADAAVFPGGPFTLLRLGEENAQLGAMALHAAEIDEERSQVAVQRLVAMMVPAITIVMGAAVAGIVASLLSAMLSLNNLAEVADVAFRGGPVRVALPWLWLRC